VVVAPDGKFVYAANRLHDSIAFFSVGPDGRLTLVGEEWTRGDYPRSFYYRSHGEFPLLVQSEKRSDRYVSRESEEWGAQVYGAVYGYRDSRYCGVFVMAVVG
jgi:6-phosphogluconolactonase (cycloisomerase 2 family)